MRNLGRFVGHVISGVRTDPNRHELSRNVEEREVQTPTGRVTLRRTVIEEVELQPDDHTGDTT